MLLMKEFKIKIYYIDVVFLLKKLNLAVVFFEYSFSKKFVDWFAPEKKQNHLTEARFFIKFKQTSFKNLARKDNICF